MSRLVLPGEILPADVLPVPASSSATLKLGPGLRHVPPSTITPVLAGLLCVDQKKNAIWVEHNNGRVSDYIPGLDPVLWFAPLTKYSTYPKPAMSSSPQSTIPPPTIFPAR